MKTLPLARQRIEHALVPGVQNLIMPVFALANAGVTLGGQVGGVLADPINLGILCGLVLGKPVGIVLFAWQAVRAGLAAFPAWVKGTQILGAGTIGAAVLWSAGKPARAASAPGA